MALTFPSKPEIRVKNPPLLEVVCQVKFPPILSIAKELPSEFQERIRHQFPELEVEQGFLVRLPGISNPEIPAAEIQPKIYRFRSSPGFTAISLAADFYAVSTNHYTHWDDFVGWLRLAQEAAQQVYNLTYSPRIGLRYINRLTLENTGRKTAKEMLDLLRPELTAQLHTEAWTEPLEMLNQLLLDNNPAKLSLRTGFGKEHGEPFFLLDIDYFEEGKLNLDDLVERCNAYHGVIHDAFRWCLRDEAIAAFGPLIQETHRP